MKCASRSTDFSEMFFRRAGNDRGSILSPAVLLSSTAESFLAILANVSGEKAGSRRVLRAIQEQREKGQARNYHARRSSADFLIEKLGVLSLAKKIFFRSFDPVHRAVSISLEQAT